MAFEVHQALSVEGDVMWWIVGSAIVALVILMWAIARWIQGKIGGELPKDGEL